MLYRETGDFKTTYADDIQTFPIKLDRVRFWGLILLMALVVPFFLTSYSEQNIFLPVFIFGIAAIGLNILTGYCGQVSLGTGGFMAVGAYACYKLTTAYPDLPLIVLVLTSGGITAAVGIFFGLPSLRIKGFYLAVATLASQFFLIWVLNKFPWFYNYSASGQIVMPTPNSGGVDFTIPFIDLAGTAPILNGLVNFTPDGVVVQGFVTGPASNPTLTYWFCLALLILFGFIARNLVRGRIGRSWMAIRDMDIAAEIIGVNPLKTKLSAFAVSSFMIGVSGALYFSVWKGAVEATEAFDLIIISFPVLFMILIGGLGSIQGSIMGATFIVVLPIVLKLLFVDVFGWPTVLTEHLRLIILGGLIIFFLQVEPHGLARLWQIAKEKLRLWPFPY